jgi:tripartite-type tricarboxylate transporter receptor subunit TctC
MTLPFKVFAAAVALIFGGAALSQNYPAKPVRIMVGYAPGGGVDTTARMVGQALGDLWGNTVIIENRPGAAGNVATEYTAKAPPDGYTLVLCNIGSHAVTPARFRGKLTYDPIRDFAFPSMIAVCRTCSWCTLRCRRGRCANILPTPKPIRAK